MEDLGASTHNPDGDSVFFRNVLRMLKRLGLSDDKATDVLKRMSSEDFDDATLALARPYLANNQEPLPSGPAQPDGEPAPGLQASAAPSQRASHAASHAASPTASHAASSTGSISPQRVIERQHHSCSPAGSTASSSGSISLGGAMKQQQPAARPQQRQRQPRGQAGGDSAPDVSVVSRVEARVYNSSTKAPQARPPRAVAAAAAASPSRSPAPNRGLGRGGGCFGTPHPKNPVDHAARNRNRKVLPSPQLNRNCGGGGRIGGVLVAASPMVATPRYSFTEDATRGGRSGLPAGTPGHGHARQHTPHLHHVGLGKRGADYQPASAGLSPAVEPPQRVAFADWAPRALGDLVDQASLCDGTPKTPVAGPAGVSGSDPPSELPSGCLSTVSEAPKRLPFDVWQDLQAAAEGMPTREAASPAAASPLQPMSLMARVQGSELALVEDKTAPLGGGGGDDSMPAPCPSLGLGLGGGAAEPAGGQGKQQVHVVAAAAAGVHVRVSAVLRARIAQAGAAAGGLPGSPIACRRAAAAPLSPC